MAGWKINPTKWPGTTGTVTSLRRPKKPVVSGGARAPTAATPTVKAAQLANQSVTAPSYAPSPNPGPSSSGQQIRTDAGANLGLTLNDINRQLLQAALNYGGDPMAALWLPSGGLQPTSVATNDPNSSLAQISRTLGDNTKSLEDSLNQNNTWFSGLHLTEQQKLNDQADRDRAQAARDYQNAVAQLTGSASGAFAGYQGDLGRANQADIDYAASQEPVAGPQPAVPANVTTKIPTSTKYPLMQMVGPNAGIAYQIVNKNGKRYIAYADGRYVPA